MDRIHYIIVRRDLPLGVTFAMVAHAAAESAKPAKKQEHLIVLGVDNEAALQRFDKKLSRAKIKKILFHEPDGPWNGQAMSIGVYPQARTLEFTKHFSNLALYREYHVPVSSNRLSVIAGNHTAYIGVR